MKQVVLSGTGIFYGGIPVNTFTTDLSEAQSLQISARMPGLRSVERLQIMGQPDRWMMGHIDPDSGMSVPDDFIEGDPSLGDNTGTGGNGGVNSTGYTRF